MSASRIRYQLNVRAALALTILALVAASGLYVLGVVQQTRILKAGLAQVKTFRKAGAEEKDLTLRAKDEDLALRHINQYLASSPDDPEAIEIQAELLTKVDLHAAISVYERLLKLDSSGERAQAARRTLARLYLQYSGFVRSQRLSKLMPERVALDLRYHTAELITDQLLDPKAVPRKDDAEAHHLRAMALEGQIGAGKSERLVNNEPMDLTDYAIREYKIALARDPGDIEAARGLARMYQVYKNDVPAARQVYDGLLAGHHDPIKIRRARFEFFKSIGDARAATAELAEAHKDAPDNVDVMLSAVEDALGNKDVVEARRWLDKIPDPAENDPYAIRIWTDRGLLAYYDQKPEKAISAWSKGLEASGGTDANLTWHLASVELELGHEAEAKKLVDQYRRLTGSNSPALQWLEMLQDERAGQYSRAVARLEALRQRKDLEANNLLQEQVLMALGRCLEKAENPDGAAKTYREIIERFPRSSGTARIALAQLLINTQPDEAIQVVEEGLESQPDNSGLLVALTAARFQQMMLRPANRRNWAKFDIAYKQAAQFNRGNLNLDLMQTQRIASDVGADQAVTFLKEKIAQNPRSVEYANGLAELLTTQGHPDQALEVIDRASTPEAAGDRGALRSTRARILASLGRGREARELMVRNLRNVPATDRADLWKNLVALCQAHGDQDTTRAAFGEWTRQFPDDIRPKDALLDLAIRANDEKQIEPCLQALDPGKDREKTASNDQANVVWHLAQAKVLLWKRSRIQDKDSKSRKDLLEHADNLVRNVLQNLSPDNLAALLLQGLILEEQNNVDSAIQTYQQAWKHGNPDALLRLITLLARSESENPDQEDKLDELRRTRPSGEFDQIVALARLRNGSPQKALTIVDESLRTNRVANSWQVEIYDHLGEYQKAEGVLRRMAERQADMLEPWLTLLRYQAAHGRSTSAVQSIPEILKHFKTATPELIEAQCQMAAANRPGADQAIETALKRSPDDRAVLLVAERYFEETGRNDRAAECLKRLVDQNSKDRPVARQLAILLSSRPDSWARALQLLGPEGPPNDTTEDRLARGIVLARSSNATQRKEGINILEVLVADLPANHGVATAARGVLARLFLASGEADRASRVAAVSAMSGSDPTNIALYAESLLRGGDLAAAEAQIDRLAKVGDASQIEANLRARLIQARGMQQLAKTSGTAAALEQAYLAREKTPGEEIFGREIFPVLVAMGPEAQAVAERVARQLALHHPELSWMPATIQASQGHADQALELCRKSAQAGRIQGDLRESSRIALEVAVSSRVKTSALEQASAILDIAISHNPDADEILVMKAMINHLLGLYDAEIKLYRTVQKRQPRNPVVLNNLAWALSEGLNQPTEALETIDTLIKQSGRQVENLDTRGVVLIRLGRLDLAIKDLEEAVQAEPSGLHFYHLAHAYQKAGRDTDFRKAFDHALQLGLTAESVDPTERAEFEAFKSAK